METSAKYQIKSEKGYYARNMKGNTTFYESHEMGYILTQDEVNAILPMLEREGFINCECIPFIPAPFNRL
jgi:hypothetical protein